MDKKMKKYGNSSANRKIKDGIFRLKSPTHAKPCLTYSLKKTFKMFAQDVCPRCLPKNNNTCKSQKTVRCPSLLLIT